MNMIQPNGESLSSSDHPRKKGSYTGERLTVRKGQAIINALARGQPVERIARQLYTSKHTVIPVREREWHDIAHRKQLIAASAARLAANGFDRLNAEMDVGNIKGALLVPVTGMAIDKVIALSADAPVPVVNVNLQAQAIDLATEFKALNAAIREKAAKAKMISDSRAETSLQPNDKAN